MPHTQSCSEGRCLLLRQPLLLSLIIVDLFVFDGRQAGETLEEAREVMRVAKAEMIGNFADVHRR